MTAGPTKPSVVVVGCGVFGVHAAIELAARRFCVTVLDPGPLPHPDASSTDISKAVRMDYGSDELYTELADRCIERWHEWNRLWSPPPYHQDGFLLMTRSPMKRGEFEHNGFALLAKRGCAVERMDASKLSQRFPAWNAERYVDGYLNPRGGWVESGRVVRRRVNELRDAGVVLCEGARFARLIEDGSRVCGVVTERGDELRADFTLVAAGAWTPTLLPQLDSVLQAKAQPVLHFRPKDPGPYRAERFPVWGADISRTGWYGFPVTKDGIVKIGYHGAGEPVHPDAPRKVRPIHEARCREFLRGTFPGLADAPLVAGRLCLYCDSWDGNFWIDHDPGRRGLVVAAGGSGHGFKFAPLLGPIIADVLERKPNRYAARFAWRERGETIREEARYDDPEARDGG